MLMAIYVEQRCQEMFAKEGFMTDPILKSLDEGEKANLRNEILILTQQANLNRQMLNNLPVVVNNIPV